jgi:hypothetical protein
MAVGKTEVGKVQTEKNCDGCRWLVRGAGVAYLEHLQIVPHDFHPTCNLICLPLCPKQEVNTVHYRKGPSLMHQIKIHIP